MIHDEQMASLASLRAIFNDLTEQLNSKQVGSAEARNILRTSTVTDVDGYLWRLVPPRIGGAENATFERRMPDSDSWEHAEEDQFAVVAPLPMPSTTERTDRDPGRWGSGQPGTIAAATAQAPARPKAVVTSPAIVDAPRPPGMRAVAKVAGFVVAIVIAGGVAWWGISAANDGDDPQGSSSSTTPSATSTAIVNQGYPTPSQSDITAALHAFATDNLQEIAKVADSQYSEKSQLLYAATFAGWLQNGLTITPRQPVGVTSGLEASQVWEVWDRTDAIAIATVTWRRATTTAPWRLAAWPEFSTTR